jgi:predicted O-linked N-acetylglucosamine transferase (SPINDLY family)
MESYNELLNTAKKFHLSGNIVKANKLYSKLMKFRKNDFLILYLYGTTFLQLKKYSDAIKYLSFSIIQNSKFADSFNNRGIAYAENSNFDQAIKDYDQSIKLKENNFDAYLNKGIALKNIFRFKEAINHFNISLKLRPNDAKVYYNSGNVFLELNNFNKALELYNKAILLQKNYSEAYAKRGEVNFFLKNYDLSMRDYSQSIKLNSDLDYVYGLFFHLKMCLNDWNNFDAHLEKIKDGIKKNKKIVNPLNLLSLIDDPEIHLKTAKQFSKNILISHNYKKTSHSDNNKIKIGYFSADFNKHAVSRLIYKMLCLHNRKKFKIYSYAYGFDKEDDLHNLIKKEADVYRDIREISDHDVALLAKKDDLDIAIDLQGYTDKSRLSIFANKVAPIQINYLGYPGSMGAEYIDYIVADKNLIPKSNYKFYSEKIIFMPHHYQVQNNELMMSNNPSSRKDLGLPKNYFVFCAINNTYKISPNTFDVWMRLLTKVKKSVLWLLDNGPVSNKNLLNEAKARGIKENRLVFAKKTSFEEYLAQLKYADIYLDTFTYNAGATASNVLWMGIPIVTKIGNSYSARMASSLLKSIDLPELITTSSEAYEKLALDLSTNPEKLKIIKEKLKVNLKNKPLFNTKLFTKHFENGLEQVFKNYIDGNNPKNIFVKEDI